MDLETLKNLAGLGPSVIISLAFLWYLERRDRSNIKIYEDFNKTITNHMVHELKANKELTKVLQKLSDGIYLLTRRQNASRK